MKIEIKNRFSDKIIFYGDYESIRECLIKAAKQSANLRGAYLQDANLQSANLQSANLRGAYLQDANLRGANLWGANLRGAYLRDANLWGAYLQSADLQDANLRGANLQDAYLRGANLRGAKNYSESHYIFNELIRRQSIKLFTKKEWAMIGKIMNKTLCWPSIKKECGKPMMKIFKKLSKLGFDEYEKKYKEVEDE